MYLTSSVPLHLSMDTWVASIYQCSSYQNTNIILLGTRTHNPKIYIELQKTPTTQSNLENEEQSWRYHAPSSQTILQSSNNQNNMVLTQSRYVDQ